MEALSTKIQETSGKPKKPDQAPPSLEGMRGMGQADLGQDPRQVVRRVNLGKVQSSHWQIFVLTDAAASGACQPWGWGVGEEMDSVPCLRCFCMSTVLAKYNMEVHARVVQKEDPPVCPGDTLQ